MSDRQQTRQTSHAVIRNGDDYSVMTTKESQGFETRICFRGSEYSCEEWVRVETEGRQ